MAAPEPYLAPPTEASPRPRLDRLRGPLWVVIALVILGAAAAFGILADRQDPTLDVPGADSGVPDLPAEERPGVPGLPDRGP
ncbi:hypothetical protein [Euzebya tangerina]|uniref:hypothetical protein n=1 Tax=Euzebya tangerina TaxID=591198 RepID=UPI000E30E803|nr:hypothetical protein [Euzebya tangerina]